MRLLTSSVFITIALFSMACQRDSDRAAKSTPTSRESVPTSQKYQLPSDISLEALAERGPEGQIFITGSTNLPDGVRIGVEIGRVKRKEPTTARQVQDRAIRRMTHPGNVVIQGSHFRSDAFLLNGTPYPAGQQEVHFFAYFDGPGQSKEILDVVGYGGKNLRGKIFRREDPDVVDSYLILDYTVPLAFPPLSRETSGLVKKAREAEAIDLARKSRESAAIELVKRSTLTVQGKGRSYATIQETVDWFIGAGGMSQGKGWSAKGDNDNTFVVTFDFIDASAGQSQAVWSADLKTKKVQYVNKLAKTFSWLPKD